MASRKTLILFYSNLEKLLKAGIDFRVAVEKASYGLGQSFSNELANVNRSIESGEKLESAFKANSKSFSSLDIMLLSAGDRSGHMIEVLQYLQDWYNFISEQLSRFRTSLIKPFLLIHATMFIVPFPDLVLGRIKFTGYISEVVIWALMFYIPMFILYLLHLFSQKNAQVRTLIDRILSLTPLIGRAFLVLDISRYCKCFHILYKAGIPIKECSQSSENVCLNVVNRNAFSPASEMVEAGKELSEGYSKRLPYDFLSRIVVAEQSGHLEETMKMLAVEYEELARKKINTIMGLASQILSGLVMVYVAYKIISMYTGEIMKHMPY